MANLFNVGRGLILIDWAKEYLTFEALEDGVYFQFTKALSYKIGSGDWTSLAASTSSPTLNTGETIMWRATLGAANNVGMGTFSSYRDNEGTTTFGKFNVYGNVYSLKGGANFLTTTGMANYQLEKLFLNCIGLIDASNLIIPVNIGAFYAGAFMFQGCSRLKYAPSFRLNTAHDAIAREMFSGCTSLLSCDNITLYGSQVNSAGCYKMFYNCQSMTTAMVELPATTLTNLCYASMFYNCKKLIESPIIKAPAVNYTGQMTEMFRGCTELNKITCLINSTNISFSNFTNGVTNNSTKIFVKHPDATWSRGNNGIPTNWTVLNAVDITVTYSEGSSGAYIKELGTSEILHTFIDNEVYKGELSENKIYEIYDSNDTLIDTLSTTFNRTYNYTI